MASDQRMRDKDRDFGLNCGTNGEGLARYVQTQAPGPAPLSEALALAAAFRNRFPEVARYFDDAKRRTTMASEPDEDFEQQARKAFTDALARPKSHEDKEKATTEGFLAGLSQPAIVATVRRDKPLMPPPRRVPKEELDAAWEAGKQRSDELRRQSAGMVQKVPADVQTMELRIQIKALVDRVTVLEAEVAALKEGK